MHFFLVDFKIFEDNIQNIFDMFRKRKKLG